jgi:hypothetical protein
MKRLAERASVPTAFGGTGFQSVCRTGKMPVPARTFQGRKPETENGVIQIVWRKPGPRSLFIRRRPN